MNTFRVLVGAGLSFIAILVLLLCFVKNPEQALFDETVNSMLSQHGFSTAKEVIQYYPKLYAAQANMERIGYLKRNIRSMTGSPIADNSTEFVCRIGQMQAEIKQLESAVKETLLGMAADYALHLP